MTEFDQFWQAYPRHRRVKRGLALRAFTKAIRKTTLAKMLEALKWQCEQPGWLEKGGQFVPHPSTWLNAEQWDDEPFHAPATSQPSRIGGVESAASQRQRMDEMKRLMQQEGLTVNEAAKRVGY